jgi:hypothetical protein
MSSPDVLSAMLGRGPGFPLAPDPARGALPTRAGAAKVRESIELILGTEPGERLMRPDFGCGLRRFLMEPNTVATRARLERAVVAALERHEPRVRLLQVTADPGSDAAAHPGADPSLVVLTIRYEHRLDATPGVLVVPFRLEG